MFEKKKKLLSFSFFFRTIITAIMGIVTMHFKACCLASTSNFDNTFFRINSNFYKIAARFMMVSTVNELV